MTPRNRKMVRNRPRFGEIRRESGQKDEESMRNLKKALPRPEKGFSGAFFALWVSSWGSDFFKISQVRQKAFFPRSARPYFSCAFSVCTQEILVRIQLIFVSTQRTCLRTQLHFGRHQIRSCAFILNVKEQVWEPVREKVHVEDIIVFSRAQVRSDLINAGHPQCPRAQAPAARP